MTSDLPEGLLGEGGRMKQNDGCGMSSCIRRRQRKCRWVGSSEKKLFSKAVSFGLTVPLPPERGQQACSAFLLHYATREALALLFCARELLLSVAAPQGPAEGHVPCLRCGDLISETSHRHAFGNLGIASVCGNHHEVRTVL